VEFALIVMVPEFAAAGFAWADASTATMSEAGGWDGAVYGMGKPLGHAETVVAVTAGTGGTYGVVSVAGIAGVAGFMVKKPQPLAQRFQSTPALVASFATAAIKFMVAFGSIRDGSEGINLTERVVDGLIVMALDLAVALGSATETAVIVTEVPVVVTGGAVYIAMAPLAVCAGKIQPQPPGTVLPHCTDQFTPPGETSFVTVALIGACVKATMLTGGV
jgi:hypothetical protein